MYAIRADNADKLYESLLSSLEHGPLVSPRKFPTVEIAPMILTLSDIRYNLITNPYRALNYAFGLVETLWIFKGSNELDMLTPYNKNIAKFSDDGETMAGAYGPPFTSQIDYIIEKLCDDRDSRQAVLTIWKPNPGPSKDIPCTVMLHFMIRDFKLNLNVYMRSNDAWLGFPYDIHLFTTIQKCVASSLEVEYGQYNHIVGSMHLYVPNIPNITWALKYPGEPVDVGDPTFSDMALLVSTEQQLRIGYELQISELLPKTAFFRRHAHLIAAYLDLKDGGNQDFPEPYSTIRERIREVRTHFKDSENPGRFELDDPDSRHG